MLRVGVVRTDLTDRRLETMRVRKSWWVRYGMAVAAPMLALVLDLGLARVSMPEPLFMTFLLAVLFCAWWGGWGPGAVATVLSAAAAETFLITPFEPLDTPALVRLVTFVTIGVLATSLVASLQRARVRAEHSERNLARANRELDERVSERTRLLQASVAELEAFGHDVAHTLRAPLRAIEGMVGIVLDDHAQRLPDGARAQLRRISESAHTMDATIVALLEYNRLGHQRVAVEPVRVREVVEGAVTEAWRRRGGPSDRFVIEGPGGARARANRMLLERAVVEVASNALVHRPPGGFANVRVRIEAAGPRVRLTFADRGPGIDARYQARIFGLFERLHSDAALGLGSGLAIARRAVERMGGTIGLMSEPGAGSTFWIDLPVASDDDVRRAEAAAGAPVADGSIEARVRRLARRVVSAATPRSR